MLPDGFLCHGICTPAAGLATSGVFQPKTVAIISNLLVVLQCTCHHFYGSNGVGKSLDNTPSKCMLLTVSGIYMKTTILDTTELNTFVV
jgi:hypothetical protein